MKIAIFRILKKVMDFSAELKMTISMMQIVILIIRKNNMTPSENGNLIVNVMKIAALKIRKRRMKADESNVVGKRKKSTLKFVTKRTKRLFRI